MIGQVQTINGVKQAIPISGAIPTGLPVGTWISFEGDQAPDNKWIKAGETFNASDYPALYLFLGGNVVPERFDHNRIGTLTSIAMTANTEITMDYDGVVMFCARRSSKMVMRGRSAGLRLGRLLFARLRVPYAWNVSVFLMLLRLAYRAVYLQGWPTHSHRFCLICI